MISDLVRAMAIEEGFFAESINLPQRNRNPLNLKFAGQEGAHCSICGATDAEKRCPSHPEGEHGFAQFDLLGRGWAAAFRQVAKWIQQGMTLDALIATQAPPEENNTTAYISHVRTFLEKAGFKIPYGVALLVYLP